MTWHRHELPPWERSRGNTAEFGFDQGDGSWVLVKRTFDREHNCKRWAVLLAPCGLNASPRPSVVWVLFEARTLKAAKMLAEIWIGER